MIIYFNGSYCNINEAQVPITDRGYVFGDGIYEVFLVKQNTFIDFDAHMKRLKRTLGFVNMELQEINELQNITRKLLEINQKDTALMYLQITRGSFQTREHDTPHTKTPTVTLIPYNLRPYKQEWLAKGITCMLAQDIRWTRRDIKSLNLLGNIMLKQKAIDCGFDDVIFYEQSSRNITEASSSNLIIVRNGKLQTHPANQYILDGNAKNRIIQLARNVGIETVEKEFSVDELFESSGAFLTNSGYRVRYVTSVDGKKIGNGTPCNVSRQMYTLMQNWIEECVVQNVSVLKNG